MLNIVNQRNIKFFTVNTPIKYLFQFIDWQIMIFFTVISTASVTAVQHVRTEVLAQPVGHLVAILEASPSQALPQP